MKVAPKLIRHLNETTADHRLLRFHENFVRGAFAPDVQIAALVLSARAGQDLDDGQTCRLQPHPRLPSF